MTEPAMIAALGASVLLVLQGGGGVWAKLESGEAESSLALYIDTSAHALAAPRLDRLLIVAPVSERSDFAAIVATLIIDCTRNEVSVSAIETFDGLGRPLVHDARGETPAPIVGGTPKAQVADVVCGRSQPTGRAYDIAEAIAAN